MSERLTADISHDLRASAQDMRAEHRNIDAGLLTEAADKLDGLIALLAEAETGRDEWKHRATELQPAAIHERESLRSENTRLRDLVRRYEGTDNDSKLTYLELEQERDRLARELYEAQDCGHDLEAFQRQAEELATLRVQVQAGPCPHTEAIGELHLEWLAEVADLKQRILDIDAHATPYGDIPDEPGWVGTYLLTAGSLHRALGKIGHSAPKCEAEAERDRLAAELETMTYVARQNKRHFVQQTQYALEIEADHARLAAELAEIRSALTDGLTGYERDRLTKPGAVAPYIRALRAALLATTGASSRLAETVQRVWELTDPRRNREYVDRQFILAALDGAQLPEAGEPGSNLGADDPIETGTEAALGEAEEKLRRVPAALVNEFHRRPGADCVQPSSPTVAVSGALARVSYIEEEARELREAVEAGDVIGAADALADLVYVVYGAAWRFGLPLDAVVAEVHRSNMTKAPTPGDGNAIKGAGYSPPDVAGVLAALDASPGDAAAGQRGDDLAEIDTTEKEIDRQMAEGEPVEIVGPVRPAGTEAGDADG